MTLTLPAIFPKWLVDAVAGYWPDCDEDAVRREGDAWKANAERCRQLAGRHDTASAAEKAALHGYSADTKSTRNAQLGSDLNNQAEYGDSMAEQCYKKANEAEFTKLQVIGTGIALLTQLVADAMLAAPGAVKAAEDRAAAEASWTAAARRRYAVVKKVGQECATKRKGLPLAKATAIGAVIGAGTGVGVNLGAQIYQKEVLHHRDEIEWDLVRDAGIIAGVAGGVGARVASRVAPRINKFLGKVAGKSESNIVRYGAHVTAGVLIGGVGGAAGGVAGAGAQILVTGHIPDGAELRDALLHGFVGGFVGSATVFAHPLPPKAAPAKTESTTSTKSSESQPDTTPSNGTPPTTGTPQTTPPTGTPQTTSPTGTPQTTSPTGTPQTTSPTGTPQTTPPTGTPQTT
ncbi:hypothetical protein, partial [Nocardia sp. NPDC049707]|uniref:WXG100-like domain-containing protein n=1 Tax=Nocardia sp. NPDC049707 TaxID=3154735 RepID=UPI00343265B4